MSPVILLFVASQIEGAFTGPSALDACWAVAVTYEAPAQCVEAPSEIMPHLGLRLETSPRPKRSPIYAE
jgi:hypothetical protein